MNVLNYIRTIDDIETLFIVYKNVIKLNLYEDSFNALLCDYVLRKMMFIIYSEYSPNFDVSDISEISDLSENDQHRITMFCSVMKNAYDSTDPLEVIYVNMFIYDDHYVDYVGYISVFYDIFNRLITNYTLFQLFELYEKIVNIPTILNVCYLYYVFENIMKRLFTMDHSELVSFSNDILKLRLSEKLKYHYDQIYWACYHLVYIDICNDIMKLCFLYDDFLRDSDVKIFGKVVNSNFRMRIISKIIQLLHIQSHFELLVHKEYIITYPDNFFRLTKRNYKRLIFYVFMLHHFYDENVCDLLKIKTIKTIRNSNLNIPRHDIEDLFDRIENEIYSQYQADSINEQLMDY